MEADEVPNHLSEIARDFDHKDRVRALELLAKAHGMLSERLNINLDRKKLVQDLNDVLDQLMEVPARKRLVEGGQRLLEEVGN